MLYKLGWYDSREQLRRKHRHTKNPVSWNERETRATTCAVQRPGVAQHARGFGLVPEQVALPLGWLKAGSNSRAARHKAGRREDARRHLARFSRSEDYAVTPWTGAPARPVGPARDLVYTVS